MSDASKTVRSFTVGEEDDGIRLDRWFKRHLPETPFNAVSRWARTGQLRLDGKRASPGDRIEAGQLIRVPPPDAAPPSGAPRVRREPSVLTDDEQAFVRDMILYQDGDAIVLDKPPGLATQGGTKTSQHLDRLLDGLADPAGERPKLVHRLDKDTSGVLLVARGARAAGHFSKAFAGRTARKVYWALVVGVPSPDEGLIDLPLAKQPGTGGEKMHVSEAAGQPARTRWRIIDRAGNRASWLELQPLTGRTHQLRVHLAEIGHPIVGDGKYGGPDAFLTGGVSRKLHLHARRLKIDGPTAMIDVTAQPPAHFAESLALLGFEQEAGDRLPLDSPDPAASPQAKQRAVAQRAKQARQARRGERRSRGSGGSRSR